MCSPSTILPSDISPIKITLSSVKGKTLPFKLRTFDNDSIPSDILPVMLQSAASKRLPTVCPFKSLVVLNLYSSSFSNKGSVSDKAAITRLKSPTAGMSNSSLNLPVDFPSSQTETTTDISTGNSFKPPTNVDAPVPPPNITTFLLINITSHVWVIF